MDYIHKEYSAAAQCSQARIQFIYEAHDYSANITECKLDGKTNRDIFCSRFELFLWREPRPRW